MLSFFFKKKLFVFYFFLFFLHFNLNSNNDWGFFGHNKITEHAIFTLPPEMFGFYKHNLDLLLEYAVKPDKRRYAVKGEAERHYIDLEDYKCPIDSIPKYWNQAKAKFTSDTLLKYGIVPWHVYIMKHRLTEAFANQDIEKIIKISGELGHYIADANVPLHTTRNYDGKETKQKGIHGFWESRLPELFYDNYKLITRKANYLKDPQQEAWNGVKNANKNLALTFSAEKEVSKIKGLKKYAYEEKGKKTSRSYSFEYSQAYHQRLNGMVEERMKASIEMVGDFWFTSWVDGGQPDLNKLIK